MRCLSRLSNLIRRPNRLRRLFRSSVSLPLRLEGLEDRTLPAAPFASALVASFYQQILSRNAEATGVSLWTNQMAAGTSATQVAYDILTSPEARQDQLTADYESILGRAPDAAGAAYWMQAFQNGASNDQVKVALLGSAEFYAHAGGTPSGFLDQLYEIVLDRAPDSQGLALFGSALASATSTTVVANAVVSSAESQTDELTTNYENVLGRGADSAGMQVWLPQMQAGMSNESIEAAFFGSGEYGARLNLALTSTASTDANVDAAAFLLDLHPSHTGGSTTSSSGSSGSGSSSSGGSTSTGTGSSGGSTSTAGGSTGSTTGTTSNTGGMTLTFDTPPISLSLTPTVTVQVATLTTSDPTLFVQIDVDLLHDGSFTDPGDSDYASAYVQPNASTNITLPALQAGDYLVRATVTDSAGDSTSALSEIDVNQNPTGNPLIFVPNVGQTSSTAQFLVQGSSGNVFITPTGPVYSVASTTGSTTPVAFGLQFDNVSGTPQGTGTGLLSSYSNYFFGDAPSLWQTNIPNYGGVQYQNVYPGIAVSYTGVAGQLTYDFTVSPGANPGLIALSAVGSGTASVLADGQLQLTDANGNVLYSSVPTVYQVGASGNHQAVSGSYVSLGNGQIGFRLGSYDPTRALIIDPTIVYSTFIGGTMDDTGNGIAVDSAGDAYIVGNTLSSDYPLVTPTQNSTNGAKDTIVVSEFDPTGKTLLYSTYLGGTSDNFGNAIAVDSGDNVYVTGSSNNDSSFPTTSGAFMTSAPASIGTNVIVFKLNSTGNALIYSTFVTGSVFYGSGTGIAVDSSGDAYITGNTGNTLATTTGAFQSDTSIMNSQSHNAFVAELNPSGSGLVYATYVAGSLNAAGKPVNIFDAGSQGNSIAIDSGGDAYITGITNESDFPTMNPIQSTLKGVSNDAFIAKLNATGTALEYSTYLGGSTAGSSASVGTNGVGIAVNSAGNAYVTGFTSATDFPTTAGAYNTTYTGNSDDVIVSELNTTGTALVYSTFIGDTSGQDRASGIALDSAGDATVVGQVTTAQYPQMNAVQSPLTALNSMDGFITTLNSTGTALIFSSNYGGLADDQINGVAIDTTGNIYITGITKSTMGNSSTTTGFFPIVSAYQPNNAGGQDIFVAKITPPGTGGGSTGGGGTGSGGTGSGGSGSGTTTTTAPIVADPYRTSDVAFDYGSIGVGSTLDTSAAIGNTSAGLPSYDWYRYEPSASGNLVVTMDVTGTGSSTVTTSMDLELHIFTLQGPNNTLVEIDNNVEANVLDKSLSVAVTPGEVYLVEVKGRQTAPGQFTFGTYTLSTTLE